MITRPYFDDDMTPQQVVNAHPDMKDQHKRFDQLGPDWVQGGPMW
jgi:hypothetical protein